MSEGIAFAWRLLNGGFWCTKDKGVHNTKIPSTPYVNNATFFPDVKSACFMKPEVDFELKLVKVTYTVEEIKHYKNIWSDNE